MVTSLGKKKSRLSPAWMSLLFRMLLLLVSSRTSTVRVVSAATTFSNNGITSAGLQTNFGGVSFAGGMSYDSQRQTLYVTGQVHSDSCFVGILKRVEAASVTNHPAHLEFLSKQVFLFGKTTF